MNFQKQKKKVFSDYEKLITKKNKPKKIYNGLFAQH